MPHLADIAASPLHDEDPFRAVFLSSPDAISLLRMPAATYAAVNPSFTSLTGWSSEEVLGRTPTEIGQWVEQRQRETLREKLASGPIENLPLRVRNRDGRVLDVLASARTVVLAGEPFLLGFMHDVTALARSARLQTALYRIGEAGGESTLRDMLAAVHRIVGELIPLPNFYVAMQEAESGLLSFPFYADEESPWPVPRMPSNGLTEYVLRTGKPLLLSGPEAIDRLCEKRRVIKIGAPCLSWLGVPLRAQDRTAGVMVTQSYRPDVSFGEADLEVLQLVSAQVARVIERKMAAERLAANEKRFRALLRHSADGVAMLDADGRMVDVIASAQVLDYPVKEMKGDIRRYLHPEDEGLFRQLVAESLARPREPVATALRMLRRDGSPRVVEGTLTNLLADPDVRGIAVNYRDVTERREMEARLMAADRLASIGLVSAGVAHEINNPLAFVMSNLDFAASALGRIVHDASDPGLARQATDALREAQEGAERIRRIVRDLRSFARPDDDDEARGGVDLVQVLDASANIAWNEIRHRARLVKDYAPGLPPVAGSALRLGQVFLNLLVNAAQAIDEGAVSQNEIRLLASESGGNVEVRVRDTGRGIAAEDMGRLFQPFFTTKPAGVGTGLGLTICDNIVTGLGGSMRVESAPGRGSTFIVTLPVARAPVAEARPRTESVPPPRRGRLLVVDDEPLIGQSIQRLITEHDVVAEVNAADALARIRGGERFDMICCDLMMPDMNGMQFFAALQAEYPDQAQRVLFLTGGAFTAAARSFLDEVSNPRLEKPFPLQNLRVLMAERMRNQEPPSA